MYITPRVLIQQEFAQVPVYSEFPLPAFIIGPQYHLTRYSEASEKPFTALGTLDGEGLANGNAYDPVTATTYDFPNVPAGGDVDPIYTKVFAEAVEAQYFPHADLANLGQAGDAVAFIPTNDGGYHSDRLHFTEAVLRTENGYSLSPVFSGRPAAIHDIIELKTGTNTFRTRIKNILPETADINEELASQIAPFADLNSSDFLLHDGVANGTTTFTSASAHFTEANVLNKYITIEDSIVRLVVGVASSTSLILDAPVASRTNCDFYINGVYNDKGNAAYSTENHIATVSYTGTNGSNATVDVANTSTSYKGYASKAIVADTYIVTVTYGTTLANALFSVYSLNNAFITKTDVALDNGVLQVDTANGNDVNLTFSKHTGAANALFAVGDSWSLEVVAPVVPTNPETTGFYTGVFDMTYKLAVIRGGAFYDGGNIDTCARVQITASNLEVASVVLPEFDSYFNVGNFGVRARFGASVNNEGLIAGDVYYIPVVAAKAGAATVVELYDNIPQATLSSYSAGTAKLFLTQKSVQIPAVRDLVTGDTNWMQDGNYITINSEMTTFNDQLTVGSTPVRLPIVAAKLFVEHRDLLQDNVVAIDSLRSLADINTKLGTVHPDNPLAQGVYDAVLNSQNQIVYFIGVATDDLAGYTEAIKISEKNDKVYSFVPLTFDRTIQDAVVSHVNAYSTAEVGRWRIAWISVEDKKTADIYVNKPDGSPYQGTITKAANSTQNKMLTVIGASFLEDGVRPNDSLRVNFRLGADGSVKYDEYVVDRVLTSTTLLLTKAAPQAINVPVKIELVRNYTKSERANNIAHIGGDYNNRRVRCVFPDTFKYGGVVKQGYFAAAGLAGLRSGVVPHQGLTNSEYLGADDLSKVVLEFSQDDLNTMAEQGIWIITQEVIGATPYVRHQLTTDTSSLNTSEDSITTNVDNISYALKKVLAPFIGRFNVNRENVIAVRDAIVAELNYRATGTRTLRAGNQLTSFTPEKDIIRLEPNATYKDRIDVEVGLNVPYPLNYINLKLIVA